MSFIRDDARRLSVKRFWLAMCCLSVVTASYLTLVLTESMSDVWIIIQAIIIIALVTAVWLGRPDDYRD